MGKIESLNENQKNEQNANKTGWGGARRGAGRHKHSKNPATIEKEEAVRQFKARVAKNVDKLFNSQFDLATGEKYLMVTRTIGKGAKARRETEIVTDPTLIKQFIDEELEDSETEWYFMTTKPANNQALEGMLNRAFGKAGESIDITSDGEKLGAGLSAEQLSQLIQARAGRSDT
jgi:hypothetical protein